MENLLLTTVEINNNYKKGEINMSINCGCTNAVATIVPNDLALSIVPDRYLQPHQAQKRPGTVFEDLLGDAIERAFASGVDNLPELISCLNRTGPACKDGKPWTEEIYLKIVRDLAD